ncbi:MAG: hypothetical protein DHS20C18_46430 [Saprospiraceae bacterium]|nr:MAG: hypothetical protein DHS20C18_46430 [Saprospiraceae bacterium]
MKQIKCSILALIVLGLSNSTIAQVNDIWIKSPRIIGGNPATLPQPKAFIELESREFTGSTSMLGRARQILRVSRLFDLGNAVSNPPDREVLMLMTNRGYLGLGTETPTSLLNLNVSGNGFRQLLTFSYLDENNRKWDYSSFGLEGGSTFWVNNAQLRKGVGGTDQWFIDRGSFNASSSRIMHGWDGIYFHYYNHDSNTSGAPLHDWKPFTTVWKQSMQISNSGQVRIGEKTVTTGDHNDYRLSVDGKIVARRLIVTDGSEWADYVFEEDYDLMPLDSLHTFILNNRHLPNIPSKKEVEKSGVDVYEMNVRLLEKVEELSLYLIELNKVNERLQQQINEINEKLD